MITRFGVARAYRRLWETEDGKVVFNDLLKFSGFFGVTVPNQGRITSETVLYSEGQRATGARIVEFLRLSSQDMMELQKDSREQRQRKDEDDE